MCVWCGMRKGSTCFSLFKIFYFSINDKISLFLFDLSSKKCLIYMSLFWIFSSAPVISCLSPC